MNNLKAIKVGFFGTPDFSLEFLKYLSEQLINISFIVSQPASNSGRGRKKKTSPVESWGLKNKIKTFTPKKINDPNFREKIKKISVDFIIVVAYGNLIDEFIINHPKYFTINIHASLLPKWRGAAPIQRSILNGDTETGVCVMKIVKKLDAGPIISREKIRISYDDDAGTIYNKIISLGKPLLLKSLKNIIANKYQLIDQKDDDACYAKKIEKIESRIFWNELAENINLKVRAFNPFPGAWTFLSGTDLRIKILKSKVIYKNSSENEKNLLIGNVNENMEVKCGKNYLKILELQMQGKKKLSVSDFMNGYKFKKLKFR